MFSQNCILILVLVAERDYQLKTWTRSGNSVFVIIIHSYITWCDIFETENIKDKWICKDWEQTESSNSTSSTIYTNRFWAFIQAPVLALIFSSCLFITNSAKPWSRAILQIFTVSKLLDIYPAFYGILGFITVSASTRYW